MLKVIFLTILFIVNLVNKSRTIRTIIFFLFKLRSGFESHYTCKTYSKLNNAIFICRGLMSNSPTSHYCDNLYQQDMLSNAKSFAIGHQDSCFVAMTRNTKILFLTPPPKKIYFVMLPQDLAAARIHKHEQYVMLVQDHNSTQE